MKSLSLVFTLILISSTLQSPNRNNCGPWCVSCDNNGVCQACHKYNLVAGKCDTAKPLTDLCVVQTISFDGATSCNICQQGAGLKLSLMGSSKCYPNAVTKNCFYEMQIGENVSCFACEGATPSLDQQTCEPGIAPNCVYGSSRSDNKLRCYICKDGYTSQNKGECVISKVKGCMHADPSDTNKCLFCDYTKGYYAYDNNVNCRKQ